MYTKLCRLYALLCRLYALTLSVVRTIFCHRGCEHYSVSCMHYILSVVNTYSVGCKRLLCQLYVLLYTRLDEWLIHFEKKTRYLSVINDQKHDVGIASLHVTSRRPCWWSRTKASLSSGNQTLFSCKFFEKQFSLRGSRLKRKGKGVRVSLAPKTPFPFPFKRLPRWQEIIMLFWLATWSPCHVVANQEYRKSRNLENERRYIYKKPRQESGLCDNSFARYSEKRFTQINKTVGVPLRCTNMAAGNQ